MAFLETPRFPLTISYESDGGPEYDTEVVVLASGFEQRNERWTEPRFSYNAACGVKTRADMHTLIAFFHAVGGRANGFRFKDWSDYKSVSAELVASNTDQVIIASATAGQTTAQLVKIYSSGGTLTRTRSISKPVAGTLILSKNNSAMTTGWSISTSGLITFSPPLSGGDLIKGGYEFDVPCRFDTDKLSTKWNDYSCGNANVPIVGIRV